MKQFAFKNDKEAFQKVRRGDMAAYRFLFDCYFADLCRFLNMYVKDRYISEEIALDIFTSLWEKKEQLVIKHSLKSYLFQSARFKAISHLRQKKNWVFVDLDLPDLQDKETIAREETMEPDKLRAIIEDAINDLPEKSQKIYRLAREEKMSHKEIAELLGVSPKTVENHVGIALKKLRISLKPYYDQIFFMSLV
ncbi:RNA polymerase sigma-70 factor [Prolixibacteraceae bacterium JC049]|nr:RNA polymerase sigma-70 factor [Prolixibacteraceae bacterium JC049]